MEHHTSLGADRWIRASVEGAGPAVVLLHGIPGSAAVWEPVAARLVDRHRVVVPDLVGFGQSARSESVDELWADAQADAVRVLLDELDIGDAVVVGHDFGGPVAAHLVSSAPGRVSGLVLAATNAFGDTPLPFPLSGIRWPLVGGLWERMLFSAPSLRMMVRNGFRGDSPRPDMARYVGDPGQARTIATIFATALHDLAERYSPVTEALRRVRVPTTVVWGDDDPFFEVAQGHRTAELIEGAELVVLERAGHFLPEERPEQLADVIANLVRKSGAASTGRAPPRAD